MSRRDIHQRRAYAERRASLAVDRQIRATTLKAKEMAHRWANAWGSFAGYRVSRFDPKKH